MEDSSDEDVNSRAKSLSPEEDNPTIQENKLVIFDENTQKLLIVVSPF
jgi:hypothetical protein